MSQLERDLTNNAWERLNLWIRDTAMRCDAANVSGPVVASIILSCLLNELLEVTIALKIPREDLLSTVRSGYDEKKLVADEF